jgi:hypothetical protein
LKPELLPLTGSRGKRHLRAKPGPKPRRTPAVPTYLYCETLGFEPEHFVSRLARSTCCQRPTRLPPERRASGRNRASARVLDSRHCRCSLSGPSLVANLFILS